MNRNLNVFGVLLTCLAVVSCVGVPECFIEDTSGIYIHKHSGVPFPKQMGKYYRVRAWASDPEGFEIGVEYIAPGGAQRNSLKIYLYPTGYRDSADLEKEFNAEQNAFRNKNEDSILWFTDEWIDENEILIKQTVILVPSYDPNKLPEAFDIEMCIYKNWYIKTIATFPIPLTVSGTINENAFEKALSDAHVLYVVLPETEAPATF
jgi:hypothetical protein